MAKTGGSSLSTRAALVFQGGIGVVGLLAIWLFGIPVRWGGLGGFELLLYGAIGAVGSYLTLILLTRIPGLLPDNLEQQMRGLHSFARSFSWTVLVVLSVLAGVGEELLFRGAVQGWLIQHTGPWTAVIASSVLFGLVHYVSFTYFLVATGLGLVLGAAYHLSASLGMVMLWHALYDVVALYCLLRFPHWFGIDSTGSR